MTFANWLTVLRILLIPFFITTLIYQQFFASLIIFVSAILTDALDGFVARRTRMTKLGKILDPTADKLLLVSAYILLPVLGILPIWVAVVVVSRDVIIALGYLIMYLTWNSTKIDVRVLGKISTFVQSVGIGFFILGQLIPQLEIVTLVMITLVALVSSASGLDYIIQGIKLANHLSHHKQPDDESSHPSLT